MFDPLGWTPFKDTLIALIYFWDGEDVREVKSKRRD